MAKTKICHKYFKIVPLKHKCPHEVQYSKEEIDKYYKNAEWRWVRGRVIELHPKCARCKVLVKEGRREYNPLDYLYGNDKVDVLYIRLD